MKKIIIGIIIGIALSLGTLTFASYTVNFIQVPQYIGNYKTMDLLVYLAQLKDKDNALHINDNTPTVNIPAQPIPYTAPLTPYNSKRVTITFPINESM
jgi:hypothetical protein